MSEEAEFSIVSPKLPKLPKLVPHPANVPTPTVTVEIDGRLNHGHTTLIFHTTGPGILVRPPAPPLRADHLWRTTCFELFVQPVGGPAYFEFNFSPSTRWAAYAFDDYRAGMRDLDLPAPPVIERLADGVRVVVDLSGLPPLPWRVGLCAVIEEIDCTKSYWALAHPSDKPDFHHPDSFTLELPAAS